MNLDCILAIETSFNPGAIALQTRGETNEALFPKQAAHGRSLLPCLNDLLLSKKKKPSEIQLIVVGVGPGSYTGLRVGIATALTLADAARCPIVGVSSLVTIAESCPDHSHIVVIQNAYGGDLYLHHFQKKGSECRELKPVGLQSAAEVLVELEPGCLLVGDGISLLPDHQKQLHSIAEPSLWTPKVSKTLEIGLRLFQKSGPQDPNQVRPLYLRPSRAEIQQQQRKNTGENFSPNS